MIRILILSQADADFQTLRSIQTLGRLGSEFEIQCRTIGSGGAFRNYIDAFRALRRGQWDLIHTWGCNAMTCAALAGAVPLLVSPAPLLGRRGLHWLSAIASYRSAHLVCASATQQSAAMGCGLAEEKSHLIRPGVDFARVRGRRNPQLRQALGLEPGDFVLLSPGESTREAGHERAMWTVAILHELNPRYKLLAWGRGTQARAMRRLADRLHRPRSLCVATERLGPNVEFEEILSAANAALVTAAGPVAPLPICLTMAAGLPIISTAARTISELLEDRHTALLVGRPTPRLIAQRVLDLQSDPQLSRSIADRARTEAYDYFSQTRFLDEYRALYRQLTGTSAGTKKSLAYI